MIESADHPNIKLNLRKIPIWLFAIAGVLLLGHIIGQVEKYIFDHSTIYGLVPLFDLNNEKNIPSFFQSMILVFSSVLLTLIWKTAKQQIDRNKRYWGILAIGFFYMSMDEWFMLHEKTNQFVRNLIEDNFLNFLRFPWILLGIIVVVIAILIFSKFVLQLDRKIKRMFILAAVLYVLGAIGFEFLGGLFVDARGADNLAYSFISACEETLEMIGVIFWIKGLLGYLSQENAVIIINPESE
jgi:hypothetical protein